MAEEFEKLIFPNLRISELKRDVEEKRRRLETSSHQLTSSVRQTIEDTSSPLSFIKKNPKLAIGAVVTTVTAVKAIQALFFGGNGKKKKSPLSFSKMDMAMGLAKMGGTLFSKMFIPLTATAIQLAASSFFKKNGAKE